jgi:hypothetical protein
VEAVRRRRRRSGLHGARARASAFSLREEVKETSERTCPVPNRRASRGFIKLTRASRLRRPYDWSWRDVG